MTTQKFTGWQIFEFQITSKIFPKYFRVQLLRKNNNLNVEMADKKPNDGNKEKKRKESILDLSKYLEKHIRVKFAGGREVSGKL